MAPASPLIKQLNNGNWLDPKEAESLRDELYYQRAIHACMTMLPALNTIGMRDGSEKAFGAGQYVLPIWKQRMDSRTMVPTPNAAGDGRNLYYKDRQYENVWAGATADRMQESYLDVDQRAGFVQIAYSSVPAMVMHTTGAGSKYPNAVRDKDGNFLNGSNTYKLRLPDDLVKVKWRLMIASRGSGDVRG